MRFLAILLISLFASSHTEEGITLTRNRRYLLYPDGDPARIQLIIGVGTPLDLDDEAVTIGYVIKMLYHVPQNSTDYTTHWYEAAVNVRSHDGGGRSHRMIDVDGGRDDKRVAQVEDDGKTIVEQIREERRRFLEEHRKIPVRWDIYKVLEHMMNKNGMSGRACILRTICEAAETPFTYLNGLFGEMAHIIFTPSTSRDEISEHSDNEYHAAEKLGLDPGSDCEDLFPECESSFLELFSEVGLNFI